ncbi:MAG: hypothetical protein WCD81_08905 [Candidatus Bathyarchaeia archaeon]
MEDRIRGWLPKEPTLPSHQRIRATRAKNQKSTSIRPMKWLAISGYVALLLFIWLDYFIKLTGYATLEDVLLYTIIAPLVTFAGFKIYFKIYQIASLKFWQWYWTIFGIFIFGFLIWSAITFLLNRVLLLSAVTGEPFVLFPYFLLSYVIGGYLGYRFGKRRGFRPLIFAFTSCSVTDLDSADFVKVVGIAFVIMGVLGLILSLMFQYGQPYLSILCIVLIVLGAVLIYGIWHA